MLDRSTNNTHVLFGDDLTDVERYIAQTPRKWSKQSSATTTPSQSWDLGVGYAGALRLAREGWSQGAIDFHTAVQALPVHAREISTGWDVAGEYPDVGRYTAGDPLHMHVRTRKPKKPVVHLVINVAASAGTSGQAMKDFGAAMCAIVDQLENSGRRVELDVVAVGENQHAPVGKRRVMGWKVKRADDALDLGAVAFSIAHPGCYRRLIFALYERTKWEMSSGYSLPAQINAEELEMIGAADAFSIQGIRTSYYSGARDMLRLAAERVNTAAGETLVELEQ